MLEKTWSVFFYQKKSKYYKKGPVDIYMRITVDGIPKDVSTKMKFDLHRWNAEAGRASGTKEDARELNHLLDTLLSKVHAIRRNLIDAGQPITADTIRKILGGNDEHERTILKLYQEHNEQMAKLVAVEAYSPSTLEQYQVGYRHAEEFIRWKYQVDDLNIRALDLDFVESYANWFKTEKKDSHNTAIKNIGALKKTVLACVRKGWLSGDPFALFPMKEEEVDTVFLMPDELSRVAQKKFASDRVSAVRDVFMFCCMTSLAFVDVKHLKKSEVVRGIDGGWWIMKKRQKTKAPIPVPLLPLARQILDRYKDHPRCVASETLLPVLSNQRYNEYLKEIADCCGINKKLTTHVARHTFATTVAIMNGMPLETVKEVMGHADIKQTQHYAKIIHLKISQDMKMLNKTMKKNKFLETT